MAEGCGRHVCDKVKKSQELEKAVVPTEQMRGLKGTHRLAGFHQWTVVNVFV